jgi:hypothetical protein
MDFDETRLYYSHQQLQTRNDAEAEEEDPATVNEDETHVDLSAARRHFREFLREYVAEYRVY